MPVNKSWLASLSSLAITASGVIAISGSAQAADATFNEHVNRFAEVCGVEHPADQATDLHKERRHQCCSVIRQIGVNNTDVLQAIALGDPRDPALAELSDDLRGVLLSCRQEAIDRLAQLAIGVQPAAPPESLYTA